MMDVIDYFIITFNMWYDSVRELFVVNEHLSLNIFRADDYRFQDILKVLILSFQMG